MTDAFDKKSLSERDICSKYISPASRQKRPLRGTTLVALQGPGAVGRDIVMFDSEGIHLGVLTLDRGLEGVKGYPTGSESTGQFARQRGAHLKVQGRSRRASAIFRLYAVMKPLEEGDR